MEDSSKNHAVTAPASTPGPSPRRTPLCWTQLLALASAHRRKYPLNKPVPDLLTTRYEPSGAGLGADRWWQIAGVIAGVVGGIAAVAALFKG